MLPRRLVPLAVLAISLCLTLVVTLLLGASARAREWSRFENGVETTSDRIQGRLDVYIALLRGSGALFTTQQEVTPREFADFVELFNVELHYPGIQGIGFSQRLSREEGPRVEQWMRTEGGRPGFHIWPESTGEELHSIVMLEPLHARNQAALGFDMASEPTRREAMERARDTGLPALSGRVTLKQEIDENKQPGFLIYLPVYRGDLIPATVAERRERLIGFAYSPFRAGDLLQGIFGTVRKPRVAFELYDGPEVDPERLLYRSHAPEELAHEPLRTTSTLVVAGRPWTLAFATLPAFEESSVGSLALPFAVVGVLLSLALFGMTLAQRRAHEAAERGAEVLREEDRRKDEFLAMLAHELRNPLAPMRTAIHLMKRKLERGARVDHEREVMERQVHHLGRLVDDLLDVSRVTQGKIHLHRRPVDLVEAAWSALESVRPFAEGRGHALRARLPESPVWTEADPVRLEQVLTNLLNNAVKYTEPGGLITLSLACEAGQAAVRVEDTGLGIPAEAQRHLFEPFMQVGRTLERAQGGLGLGLTLVKRLVELHGGRVEVASEGVGRGSVFTVFLPLLPEEQVPLAPEERPRSSAWEELPTGSRRVLVVDDNVDAAEMLAEVLELDGHEVLLAHDGPGALEQVRARGPEVVLLDIGLPGLDGYEVARRLRCMPGGEALLLVALTGYGQATDRQRSREAGFDLHLVKPVDLEQLRALVARVQAPAHGAVHPHGGSVH